jgi:protein gp37
MAWRLQHIGHSAKKYAGTVEKSAGGQLNWTGKVNASEKDLLKPLTWKKPAMIFVNSESDLFHESISFEFIDLVFAVMALSPQHTYQVLTKRPARMVEYFKRRSEDMFEIRNAAEMFVCGDPHLFHVTEKLKGEARKQIGPVHITSTILPHLKESGWFWDVTHTEFGNESKLVYEGEWPLKSIWLGVSVEDQKTANERIPLLLQVPAAVRFLSCEPLLGPLDLMQDQLRCKDGSYPFPYLADKHRTKWLHNIDWVIVGGESGKDARPMHPDWVHSLRDQCNKASVSFFFKQWGEYYTKGILLGSGKPYFRMFDSMQHWINKASTWVRGGRCISIDGRECHIGKDFQECAYPVVIMDKVGKNKSGRQLDGREWNEFPQQGKQPVAGDDPDLHFGVEY